MQLSKPTRAALLALGLWFGLDFVGVSGLVEVEPVVSLAGLMLGLLVVFLIAGILETRYVAPIYSLSLLVWMWLQVETHWGTYLFPASQRKLDWYERAFGSHLRWLPSLPGRTTPDAYHTLLALLILVNLVLAVRDTARRTPRTAPGGEGPWSR